MNALMQKLATKERGRAFVERYIAAPSEKALARERAVDFCQRTKPACEIIMENDRGLASEL